MKNALQLLLPALIPSWRFFDTIAPSPRIEIALLPDEKAEAAHWREFHPRPERRSPLTILKSLFWNPRWNESLFLVSCAERLMNGEEDFAREEIFRRIQR
ncbi:MAG: hypothetical protein LRY57_00355 [Alphaproteobacteria bacterium]|nr:hypothetical protein [Alphaproteobacteria bacterium]